MTTDDCIYLLNRIANNPFYGDREREACQRGADALEEKHGKWIDPEDPTCYKCSVCGKYATQEYGLNKPIFWRFCPNCGSHMVNEDE